MKSIKNTFKELLRYPSAIFGLAIIALLLVISVYALDFDSHMQRRSSCGVPVKASGIKIRNMHLLPGPTFSEGINYPRLST